MQNHEDQRVKNGLTVPDQSNGERCGEAKATEKRVTKNGVRINRVSDGKAFAFLQTGRPLPSDKDGEVGS